MDKFASICELGHEPIRELPDVPDNFDSAGSSEVFLGHIASLDCNEGYPRILRTLGVHGMITDEYRVLLPDVQTLHEAKVCRRIGLRRCLGASALDLVHQLQET